MQLAWKNSGVCEAGEVAMAPCLFIETKCWHAAANRTIRGRRPDRPPPEIVVFFAEASRSWQNYRLAKTTALRNAGSVRHVRRGESFQARVPRLGPYAADIRRGVGAFLTCFETPSQPQSESPGNNHAGVLSERSHFPFSQSLLPRWRLGFAAGNGGVPRHFD